LSLVQEFFDDATDVAIRRGSTISQRWRRPVEDEGLWQPSVSEQLALQQ
jgi:hypothetical protein